MPIIIVIDECFSNPHTSVIINPFPLLISLDLFLNHQAKVNSYRDKNEDDKTIPHLELYIQIKHELREADHMIIHDHDHYFVEEFKFGTLVILVRLYTGVEDDVEGGGEDQRL